MQNIYLVFGGELTDVTTLDFANSDFHNVGLFDNYAAAEKAWRSNAQRTVDNAQMRYFIVPLGSGLASLCQGASA